MELPMKIIENDEKVNQVDTVDDVKVILSHGSEAVSNIKPSNWLVSFAVVIVIVAVVPIIPILLAFVAGHYGNWWVNNNLKK
tara:strand:- start:5277 stop:5522 length:246 start_codon:yes stop_codon:yes gene_type:complete